MSRKLSLVWVLCAAVSSMALAEPPQTAVDIGSRRELFVDPFLIQSLNGVEQVLQRPQDAGVAFPFDLPWEGLFSGYVTIIQDGDLIRAYYRGHAPKTEKIVDGSPDEVTCVAESTDGIHWKKPQLGLFAYGGSTDNNLVLANASPVTHNFCPFLDTNPSAAPDQRYKAIGGTAKTGLFCYVSPDGVTWKKLQEKPVFEDKGWVFDSQNLAFWSPTEQCYVLYYRRVINKVRTVSRATSKDFIHWSAPVSMTYSNTGSELPQHQLYTNQTQPYFRAPHLYLATAARFMKGRRVLSKEQAEEIGVHPRYFGDTSDAVLMTSRGGNRYDCTFEEGFVRPGIGYSNWVSRTNYPALNIVQTGPTEMSMYVNQDYGQPTAHLHRYTLRLDGLGAIHAGAKPGTLLTKPLTFAGNHLTLNFSTSAAGGIRVQLERPNGTPIPGYTFEESVPVIGNELDRTVTWRDKGADVSALAGEPVQLRFEMQDADLFALQFVEEKVAASR